MQDKGQKETGLVSSRAFLFLSPTELCLSKGFTPKEAKSSSDPLIPPPSTSSPECELHGSQPPHPPRITGLFYQPPCLTDYFPRIESRKGYKPRRPQVQRAAPSASGVLFQAEVKLIRGLASSPFLLAPTSCLAPHSSSGPSPLCSAGLPAAPLHAPLPSASAVFPAGPLRRDPVCGGVLHGGCCVTVTLLPFLALTVAQSSCNPRSFIHNSGCGSLTGGREGGVEGGGL